MVTDNASYNTSECESTREFPETDRCNSKILDSVDHPKKNSLIGRYQAVIKTMIHHAVHSRKKDWHRLIPYSLWTLRNTLNATAMVIPYEMVYGRPARGVLAACKETWTEEYVFPST